MPEYRLTYKRCCICGKKFPVAREAHHSPLDFINFQPCKCDSCQDENYVAVNTKTERTYLNENSYGRYPEYRIESARNRK
jgi:hypothetical protein